MLEARIARYRLADAEGLPEYLDMLEAAHSAP